MMKYESGDIVLIAFPQSDGLPPKRRPAVVMLDIGDADVVVVPVTTRRRSGIGDHQIPEWQEAGLLRASWVRLAKVTCLEKTDVVRQLGCLTECARNSIREQWRSLYPSPE